MPLVVIDTGLYLACSALAAEPGGARRALLTITRLQTIHGDLLCAAAVMHEAAAHTVSSLGRTNRWRRDQAIRFFEDFFRDAVRVQTLTPLSAIRAEENYRRCARSRRKGPSLADAQTAELMRQLGLRHVVTDDPADFVTLLPDYAFAAFSIGRFMTSPR